MFLENLKETAVKVSDFLKLHEISWNQSKDFTRNNNVISASGIQLVNFLLRNIAEKPVAFEEFKEILNMKQFP